MLKIFCVIIDEENLYLCLKLGLNNCMKANENILNLNFLLIDRPNIPSYDHQ